MQYLVLFDVKQHKLITNYKQLILFVIYTDSVLHLDKLWTINQSVCSLCNNSTRHYSAPKAESKNCLLWIQTILLPHQLAM